ncbi:MAG TPA: glyoxalase/bleomycin resistance/extradiol dioxygenase family protein [Ignavibacteria bacterium]|nr:glyoxalase/bleomycin resistance/extradiol dioxygenase family protein [Ignavibacteria bacterium]
MKQLFINLPVKDVEKSMEFYSNLGFENNPLFTDENQKCMMWTDTVYVMLISKEKFNEFSNDEKTGISGDQYVYFTLRVETETELNKLIESGIKSGGLEPIPAKDYGFMKLRKIKDLDGHIWDLIYLDMEKFKSL